MKPLVESPVFRDLIPPSADEERALLEQSLLAEGCREKIVTWRGTIIDGHTRYAICQKHGIPFETTERDFADENAAKIWVVENQFGRRNLNPGQKALLAIELGVFEEVAAAAAERRGGRPAKSPATENKPAVPAPQVSRRPYTSEIVAQRVGVGETTVRAAKYVKDHDPAMAQRIFRGEIAAKTAERAVRERVERVAPSSPRRLVAVPNVKSERILLPSWCDEIIAQVRENITKEIARLESTTVPWDGQYAATGHYLREIRAAQAELRAVFERLCFPALPEERVSQPTPVVRPVVRVPAEQRAQPKSFALVRRAAGKD